MVIKVENEVICINCRHKEKRNYKVKGIHYWCSIRCKEEFYIKNYLGTGMAKQLEIKHSKKLKESRKLVLKEIEKSGLSMTEYIASIQDFKDE